MADRIDFMSDNELRSKLAAHGLPVMPITATTRPLLVKKLKSVLMSNNCQQSCNHGTMADQVYSMSNAEIRSKLAEYGYPIMPVTATTRKVLVNKLISLLGGQVTHRVVSRDTSNRNERARLKLAIENQLAHGLMPVMSLDCLTGNKGRPDNRRELSQPEINKNPVLAPEPYINSINNINRPRMTRELLQTSSNQPDRTEIQPSVFKFTPELPSFKPADGGNNIDSNRENAIRNMFQPTRNESEPNQSGSSNYTFVPNLTSLQKSKNINESSMQNIIQALTTQQEKGFQELITNLNSKIHDTFENVSNIQGENFEALLSSINSSKLEVYQKLSAEQGKFYRDLLTKITDTNHEAVQALSQKQAQKFQDLVSSFMSIKEDMVETILKHQDDHFEALYNKKEEIYEQLSNHQNEQFQQLLSSLNFIKEQNDKLSDKFDSLTLKYDTVQENVNKLEAENVENKKYIKMLEESLDLQEKKACLSRLELIIPKVNEVETKEDLCDSVKRLGKTVGVKIETFNIRDIYRLENGESPVIIEFTTVLIKEALESALNKMMAKRIKLEQCYTKDQFLEFPVSTLFFSICIFISTLCALFLLCIF